MTTRPIFLVRAHRIYRWALRSMIKTIPNYPSPSCVGEGQSTKEPWAVNCSAHHSNCSACHSNEITYNGKRMRVQGAPTLADFQSFREALNKALDQTRRDDQKFARFAKKVLADD